MTDLLKNGLGADGIDRRGFLRCMAWAGAGVVWTITGGVPASKLLGQTGGNEGFQFVQISDSHIGFNKPANADVNATLQIAIDKINALPQAPGLPDPYRRSDASGQTGGVRHARPTAAGRQSETNILCSRRTRQRDRRRQGIPGALRQGHQRNRLVQLRPPRRAFRGAGEFGGAGGHGQTGSRTTGLAEGRFERPFGQHADRLVRAYSFVDACIPIGAGAPPTARKRWAT